jgi:hypothetical protein
VNDNRHSSAVPQYKPKAYRTDDHEDRLEFNLWRKED